MLRLLPDHSAAGSKENIDRAHKRIKTEDDELEFKKPYHACACVRIFKKFDRDELKSRQLKMLLRMGRNDCNKS